MLNCERKVSKSLRALSALARSMIDRVCTRHDRQRREALPLAARWLLALVLGNVAWQLPLPLRRAKPAAAALLQSCDRPDRSRTDGFTGWERQCQPVAHRSD